MAKLMKREMNQVFIGYLSHRTSEKANPLLRLLTQASLKLQTRTDRAPRSPFVIPLHPKDIMSEIDSIYQLWFRAWVRDYVPLIMGR